MPRAPRGISNDEMWRRVATGQAPEVHVERWVLSHLPSDPRCTFCMAPFEGMGGRIMHRLFRRGRSVLNPRICTVCDDFIRDHPGGTEVDLTVLFVDVRGSSRLAETMPAKEFGALMERFYDVATHTMAQYDALIEKFVGDAVTGVFMPGMLAGRHARAGIEAARDILRDTGNDGPAPWIPLGAGVHTGRAFVGAVGPQGIAQFAVLGEVPNTAARMTATAARGELLASEASLRTAGIDPEPLRKRQVELKGGGRVDVRVLVSGPEPHAPLPPA